MSVVNYLSPQPVSNQSDLFFYTNSIHFPDWRTSYRGTKKKLSKLLFYNQLGLSKLPTNIRFYRVNTSNPGDSFINRFFFLCHTSKKWQRTFPERVFSWENVEVLASLGRESLLKGKDQYS